jgi:hypothetical protein
MKSSSMTLQLFTFKEERSRLTSGSSDSNGSRLLVSTYFKGVKVKGIYYVITMGKE